MILFYIILFTVLLGLFDAHVPLSILLAPIYKSLTEGNFSGSNSSSDSNLNLNIQILNMCDCRRRSGQSITLQRHHAHSKAHTPLWQQHPAPAPCSGTQRHQHARSEAHTPIRMDPNWSYVMHMNSKSRPEQCNLGPFDSFTPSWAPREAHHGERCFKRSVIDIQNLVENTSINACFDDFGWAGNVPRIEPIWSSTWVAPKWARLSRVKLRHVGAKLCRSWAAVGAVLATVSRCCCHVGSKRCIWPTRGRSPNRANHQSPVTFWRASILTMPPGLTDRSIHLNAS